MKCLEWEYCRSEWGANSIPLYLLHIAIKESWIFKQARSSDMEFKNIFRQVLSPSFSFLGSALCMDIEMAQFLSKPLDLWLSQ